ncbi:MAG: AbrB/MazE/SpoVT family DNA-binding domain-containing protein [Terriglobales bacterium]
MNVEFTTITSKGQLVIPAGLRRKLGMKQGTRVAVHESGGQLILQPITDEYIDSLRGMIKDADRLIQQRQRDHLEDK